MKSVRPAKLVLLISIEIWPACAEGRQGGKMNNLALEPPVLGGLSDWIQHNWDAILASFIASLMAAVLFDMVIHYND